MPHSTRGLVWVLSAGPKLPLSKTHTSHRCTEHCRWLCQDPSPHQGCPGHRDHRLWCWMMPTATAGTCRSSACAYRMGEVLGVKVTALPHLLPPGDIASGWGVLLGALGPVSTGELPPPDTVLCSAQFVPLIEIKSDFSLFHLSTKSHKRGYKRQLLFWHSTTLRATHSQAAQHKAGRR